MAMYLDQHGFGQQKPQQKIVVPVEQHIHHSRILERAMQFLCVADYAFQAIAQENDRCHHTNTYQ
ncbi:MAG: hypothetical protein A2076_12750 [Geobacteraceae bacterium GWC2_53_11]|nr:MAG: hypothetical protein A2076_12750 [Geobacteraceae bacterium GWC2_53_11]